MTKTCRVCGKKSESDWCFRHKPRTKKAESFEDIKKMKEFFISLWKKLPHYSMVSGQYLGKEPLTVFFHHILPKEKYPQAAFDKDNIILLTFDEHTNVENDMYKYEEVNKRRELLKAKYYGDLSRS